MADLRKRWKKSKAEAEKEHGTAEHLELPDIIITHEMTYEAPPGKANADRPMPLPRPLVSGGTFAGVKQNAMSLFTLFAFVGRHLHAKKATRHLGVLDEYPPAAVCLVATAVSRPQLWTA